MNMVIGLKLSPRFLLNFLCVQVAELVELFLRRETVWGILSWSLEFFLQRKHGFVICLVRVLFLSFRERSVRKLTQECVCLKCDKLHCALCICFLIMVHKKS